VTAATISPARPLRLGPIEVVPPVVLAPMAGITNAAFRRLCREQGAGLYVCEMITSRGVVEGDEKTLSMLVFDPTENLRSVQLYGVDPHHVGHAVAILAGEHGVGHVDLNFGCPVPKVTRRGGGAALPYNLQWNATVQRQVGSYALQVSYTASRGIHLTDGAGMIEMDMGEEDIIQAGDREGLQGADQLIGG